MFETTLLQTFLAIERTGGFTAAAKDLGIRQSTVSGHVARLEQQTGRQLFRRGTQTVELTPDGVAMVRFAREILAAQGQAAAYFTDTGLAGHIRFGASEDIVATGLPDILLDFRTAFPAVDLELRVGLTGELRDEVRNNRLDLALVKRRPTEDVGDLVFRDDLVWAGRPDDRVVPGEPVRLVTYPGPSVTREAAIGALERAGLHYRITCVSASQQGIRAAVAAGLGVTVHAGAILPPGLVPLVGLPDPGPTEFTLVSRTGPPSVAMTELVQAIRVGADRIVAARPRVSH
ncbi:DNA-binding transcriptional LysR family regulator [Curtobacterium sp. PhB130]|uniref:LysR family transcriptional regulator n=1 Tax=unclassified Curtobacterium TaxID=257496 RepID=UPI000F4B7440|nr:MULTISPECIES: LysR substrate-binding domain-containing protein [unclassified Curtobacterium]ROP65879.1 DNA-binding transcriptional LysR family regulator [Curtobacterium sp. ZW137]ROS74070.1 DNA-binding transcriptional LysR family regulator [Curtobacterium sp. PhB130]TCK62886.1 DNA-binding transcriptional LysR family regulator [Curtobacterium sp. PhB136]